MPKASKGASAPASTPILKPIRGLTPIKKWDGFCGITYQFEETETSVRQSGIVPDWMPYPVLSTRACIVRHEPHYVKLSRLGDGRLRLRIAADCILVGDKNFRQFLGTLLADTRLSLVKGESA